METDGLYFGKVGSFDTIDVFEVSEIHPAVAAEPRYACVALCRDDRNLPAIGGTRAVHAKSHEDVRKMAVELARTMDEKVSLIRLAERTLGRTGRSLFEWRGGKGIILLPTACDAPSPRLLLAYGRLVEYLGGEFFASIDANVGRSELRWIEQATSYTLGSGALRQTSEATAIGVCSAIHATLDALDLPAERLRRRIGNVDVALFGLGKVGFTLLRMLYDEGAAIRIWDPRLRHDGCERHFEHTLNSGAQIDEHDREILIRLAKEKRLFLSEEQALATAFADGFRPIRIVCTAADAPRWLIEKVRGKPRYKHLSAATHNGPMIIVGATNDQLGAGRDDRTDDALHSLCAAKILFVPDPIVSPGGVISASWELAPVWDADAVRRRTEEIVAQNVRMLFEDAGGTKATALTIDQAFQGLLARARRL